MSSSFVATLLSAVTNTPSFWFILSQIYKLLNSTYEGLYVFMFYLASLLIQFAKPHNYLFKETSVKTMSFNFTLVPQWGHTDITLTSFL